MKYSIPLICIGSICEIIMALVKIHGQQITECSSFSEPFITITQSAALLAIIIGFVMNCVSK